MGFEIWKPEKLVIKFVYRLYISDTSTLRIGGSYIRTPHPSKDIDKAIPNQLPVSRTDQAEIATRVAGKK